MPRTFRIALALRDVEGSIARELFLGAYSYANLRSDWHVQRHGDSVLLSWEEAFHTKPDGILGVLNSYEKIDLKQVGRAQVVVLNAAVDDHPFHTVVSDNVEAGRRAAHHLLERHLRNFAYVGASGMHYSELRKQGFREVLAKSGNSKSLPSAESKDLDELPQMFKRWVQELPLPCGLLCANDAIGARVVQVCQKLALEVPHDLAVVGITNDEMTCIQCRIPLSSVPLDFRTVGHCAASQLHEYLCKKPTIRRNVLIPPGEVAERESTRMFGTQDPLVRRALTLIQKHYREPFSVEAMCRQLGNVSRRLLERHFQETLSSSPHQEVLLHRIRHAQRLIRSSSLSLEEIGHHMGFFDAAHFTRNFKKISGKTPSQFRKAFQLVPKMKHI